MNREILIRRLVADDCETLFQAFARHGWNKPLTQYQQYLKEQASNEREVLIAEFKGEFAGYLTIIWQSKYTPFRKNKIPEIVDLNVLIKFRDQGIGTALMNAAESLIAEKFKLVGIGVGMTSDYGAAQRLYVKRGYIPDGRGVSRNGKILGYGNEIKVDDDLTLHFIKEL
jgi:ribosomal protein S18 acetylase RimI-like enzyme